MQERMGHWGHRVLGMLLMCFGVGLGGISACDDAPSGPSEPLPDTTCRYPLHESQIEGQTVQCDTITVPALAEDPSAGSMRLHIARFLARENQPSRHAVVWILGGPGQSWVSDIESLPYDFVEAFGQDILIVDQRSLGFNDPKFSCQRTSANPEDELLTYWQTCFDDLRADGVELRAFNTWEMANDIEAARAHFGYQKLNILGVSYGTTLGLQYLRQFSHNVNAAALDSVSPPAFRSFQYGLLSHKEALEAMFSGCIEDSECHTQFPELEEDFNRVFDALTVSPLTMTGGDGSASELDASTFVSTVISDLLSFFAPMAPAFVKDVADTIDNNETALREDANFVASLFDIELDGVSGIELLLSVICAANQNFGQDHIDAQAVQLPVSLRSYVDLYTDVLVPSCAIWPVATPPSDAFDPVSNSTVPVLLLSGVMDPRTPLSWAVQAAVELQESTHQVFGRLGHSLISEGQGCVLAYALDYLRSGGSRNEFNAFECSADTEPPFFASLSDALSHFGFDDE